MIYQQVRETVEKQPPGALLALSDFNIPQEKAGALAKALSRLHQQGRLQRLIKGLYFKPRMGILGEITTPSYEKVLAKLLVLYKDKISYVTGVNVFSSMGLTTQIANAFVIATDRPRTPVEIGPTRVRFIQSHVKEAVADISLVQLLDAIWNIKNIPATTPQKAARVLLGHLKRLTPAQRKHIAALARSYPPQTRALTGLLLESVGETALASELKLTLNPLSTFRIPLNGSDFPSRKAWHIV